jgi:hypothetical protein
MLQLPALLCTLLVPVIVTIAQWVLHRSRGALMLKSRCGGGSYLRMHSEPLLLQTSTVRVDRAHPDKLEGTFRGA